VDLTPRGIQDKQFNDAFRGYNHEEVDLFLDQVAESFDKVFNQNQTFHHRLKQLEEELEQAKSTDDMLKRTLLTASRTADEAIEEARSKAEVMISAASSQAAEILAAAEQKRDEMIAEAESRAAGLVEGAQHKERELQVTIEGLKNFSREYRARLKAFIESQLHAIESGPEQPPEVPGSRPTPVPGRTNGVHGSAPSSEGRAVEVKPAEVKPTEVKPAAETPVRAEAVPVSAPKDVRSTPVAHSPAEPPPPAAAPVDRAVSIPDRPAEASPAMATTGPAEPKAEPERSIKELFWGEE